MHGIFPALHGETIFVSQFSLCLCIYCAFCVACKRNIRLILGINFPEMCNFVFTAASKLEFLKWFCRYKTPTLCYYFTLLLRLACHFENNLARSIKFSLLGAKEVC